MALDAGAIVGRLSLESSKFRKSLQQVEKRPRSSAILLTEIAIRSKSSVEVWLLLELPLLEYLSR